MPDAAPSPEPQALPMIRRFTIAMALAGLLLAALAPDGLEQWLAGLPYSPAAEEALTYVRAYQGLATRAGLLRPSAAVRDWMTGLRAQTFAPKPDQ